MVRAPDFDRKMLFVATQLAHEHQMKFLLLDILQAMAASLNTPDKNIPGEMSSIVEGLTLAR